jgi:hypothetical protein
MWTAWPVSWSVIKFTLDRLMQRRLILLHRQHIFAAGFADFLGDILLRSDGIDGHRCAFEIDQPQQLGDGCQFLTFALGFDLGEHLAVVLGEGTDHVGHADLVPAALERSANALAIDGHELALRQFDNALHPREEAALEFIGVKPTDHTAKRVSTGDAMFKIEERAKPIALGIGKVGEVIPAIGSANRGAQGHDKEIDESMPHIGGTGVGEIGKVTQGDNIRRAIHDQLQPGLRLPNQRARDNGGYLPWKWEKRQRRANAPTLTPHSSLPLPI